MTVYVTFNRFDLAVQYVGTDKQAALDARQMTDDVTHQREITITRVGEDYDVRLEVPVSAS